MEKTDELSDRELNEYNQKEGLILGQTYEGIVLKVASRDRLAGKTLIRDFTRDPLGNLIALVIDDSDDSGKLHYLVSVIPPATKSEHDACDYENKDYFSIGKDSSLLIKVFAHAVQESKFDEYLVTFFGSFVPLSYSAAHEKNGKSASERIYNLEEAIQRRCADNRAFTGEEIKEISKGMIHKDESFERDYAQKLRLWKEGRYRELSGFFNQDDILQYQIGIRMLKKEANGTNRRLIIEDPYLVQNRRKIDLRKAIDTTDEAQINFGKERVAIAKRLREFREKGILRSKDVDEDEVDEEKIKFLEEIEKLNMHFKTGVRL